MSFKKGVAFLLSASLFFISCGKGLDKSFLLSARFQVTQDQSVAAKFNLSSDGQYPATIHWKVITDRDGNQLSYVLRAEVLGQPSPDGRVSQKPVLTCKIEIPVAMMPVHHFLIPGAHAKIVETGKFWIPCGPKSNLMLVGRITTLGDLVPDPNPGMGQTYNEKNLQLSKFVIQALLKDLDSQKTIGQFSSSTDFSGI